VLGVAGIVGTYWTGKRQAEATVKVAAWQIDAQVTIAREARQQQRKEAAYGKLLGVLIELERYAETVVSLTMDGQPPHDADPPEGFYASLAADGELAIYWTSTVRQLVDNLRGQLGALNQALLLYHIHVNEAGHDDQELEEELNSLWDRTAAVRLANTAVRDEMSRELNLAGLASGVERPS
jgi:hypothetical protein